MRNLSRRRTGHPSLRTQPCTIELRSRLCGDPLAYNRPVTLTHLQGTFIGVDGQIRESGEMSIAMCCAIVEGQGYERQEALAQYIRWADSLPPWIDAHHKDLFSEGEGA